MPRPDKPSPRTRLHEAKAPRTAHEREARRLAAVAWVALEESFVERQPLSYEDLRWLAGALHEAAHQTLLAKDWRDYGANRRPTCRKAA